MFRAHEISTAQRVLRAAHSFGVLAIPVPVHGELVGLGELGERRRQVESSLAREHGSDWELASASVRSAHALLCDPVRQRAEIAALIAAGLQPVTSELVCPINTHALRRYVVEAGPEADVAQYDKHGRTRGTLREAAQRFLRRVGARTEVSLAYQHSLLGAELVAAGFVVASREYACRGQPDPFRLPRPVREVALAHRGSEMDDSACYPRACLAVFGAGAYHASQLLAGPNREVILAEVGLHYFGPYMPASERRKHAKQMFNALDNDGSLLGWMEKHDLAMAPPPRFKLPDGTTFVFQSYVDSRADLTAEFAARMPAMNTFVADWLRSRGDVRADTSERTAKSYFLQEPEGISRRAKVMWGEQCSGVRITNLQHDGVVVESCRKADPAEVSAALSAVCSDALGYWQPVEGKGVGDDAHWSDAESSE